MVDSPHITPISHFKALVQEPIRRGRVNRTGRDRESVREKIEKCLDKILESWCLREYKRVKRNKKYIDSQNILRP